MASLLSPQIAFRLNQPYSYTPLELLLLVVRARVTCIDSLPVHGGPLLIALA